MGVTCECAEVHERRRIVLTGGPGAGKTAVLELIRQSFCEHVKVLPEAAGVIFGGGFPRQDDPECKRAAQRAIFYVQRELEHAGDSHNPTIVLCDRGTLDGLAYWPGDVEDFLASLGTTPEQQIGSIPCGDPSPYAGRGSGVQQAEPAQDRVCRCRRRSGPADSERLAVTSQTVHR